MDSGYLFHLSLYAKVLKYCLQTICKCPKNSFILFPGSLEPLCWNVMVKHVTTIHLRNGRTPQLVHMRRSLHLTYTAGWLSCRRYIATQPDEITAVNQQVWGLFFKTIRAQRVKTRAYGKMEWNGKPEPCTLRNNLSLKDNTDILLHFL